MSITEKTQSWRLYFSYSQFMVYDKSEQMPGCAWTDKHTAQGFARRESTVCFGSLLEFGWADIKVTLGSFDRPASYERVIAVPFRSVSGIITVEGPDEIDTNRVFEVPTGHYQLTAAQAILEDDEEQIDLFFERLTIPLEKSSILVADEMLTSSESLLETSGIAGA